MARVVKVLSIDGGGARGLIPSLLLSAIEKRCAELLGAPRAIHQLFDVIAGASTGAVVTILLTKPQPATCEQLVMLYAEHARNFFYASFWHRLKTLNGWIGPKYPSSSVANTLKQFIGTEPELKDALQEIVIPIYDMRRRWPRVFTFSRSAAREDPGHNFRMWQVAEAATSAPTYFPSVPIGSIGSQQRRTYHPVDGAVYMNNPAAEGLAHAIRFERDRHGHEETRYLVVSVGTGYHDEPLRWTKAAHWGRLGWAIPLLDVVGESQAEATAMVMTQVLGENFVRFQPILKQEIALDDCSPRAAAEMRRATEELLSQPETQRQLERVCHTLCGDIAKAGSGR